MNRLRDIRPRMIGGRTRDYERVELDSAVLDEEQPGLFDLPDPSLCERLERAYLIVAKAAEVAAALEREEGPAVECIEHPEWGRMPALAAARLRKRGANTPALMAAIRRGSPYEGLYWCWAGERAAFRPRRAKRSMTRVRNLDTGETYDCIQDAADATGVNRNAIYGAAQCRHRAGGCRWRIVGGRAAARKAVAA